MVMVISLNVWPGTNGPYAYEIWIPSVVSRVRQCVQTLRFFIRSIRLARRTAMTIKVGDRIPNTMLNYLKDGVQAINTDEIFKGKKVVLFSVPGAFTPTCSAKHLPGYVEKFGDFKKKRSKIVEETINQRNLRVRRGEEGERTR